MLAPLSAAAGEKQKTTELLEPSKTSEKMYKLDDHVVTVVAGLTADANILINNARVNSQRYTYSYQEPMPVEQLVQRVCNFKQAYTMYGGLRPFGVGFLFAGWDVHFGYQVLVLSACSHRTKFAPVDTAAHSPRSCPRSCT